MSRLKQVDYSPVIRGFRYEDYALAVGEGELWCRADFAEHFGVHVATAIYHADRAVSQGLLKRQWGFINNQPGYLYSRPAEGTN
jgi:hypothetical protein